MLSLILSTAIAAAPGDDAAWDSLTKKPVPIWCVEKSGVTWCRSRGHIAADRDSVASALEDMRLGSTSFESVVSVKLLAPDTIHVVLDYPSPLTDRDYVAKYTLTEDGEAKVYTWVPIAHDDAPATDSPVRLPNFEGSWRIEPADGGSLVTYTWHAEIAGSFPAFAYKTAWKKAGHEALKDLANTQGAELSAPK